MSTEIDFGPIFFEKFGVTFKKDEIIFCENEPGNTFYFLIEGKVKITKLTGNTEKILDILNPGEIFGEMAILEESPRSATLIAQDNVKALEFNKENFESILASKPEIAVKLLKVFARRIYDQKRKLMILALPEPELKVADTLIILAEQAGYDASQKAIKLKVNQNDIASWSGMDKVECSQILSHLVKQRKLVVYSNEIIIENLADLYRMVNSRRKNLSK